MDGRAFHKRHLAAFAVWHQSNDVESMKESADAAMHALCGESWTNKA